MAAGRLSRTSRLASTRPLRRAAVLASSLGLALGAVLGAGPSAAQVCDPIYGCIPTSETTESVQQSCNASTPAATTGETVNVTAFNVPPNITLEFRLGGQVVATEQSGAATAFSAAAPGFTDVSTSFTVPSLPPGNYELSASGPGYFASCTDAGGFGVQAQQLRRDDGGGGSLARTGMTIGLLLLLAIALVAVGRAVLAASDRRRVPVHAASTRPRNHGADRTDR